MKIWLLFQDTTVNAAGSDGDGIDFIDGVVPVVQKDFVAAFTSIEGANNWMKNEEDIFDVVFKEPGYQDDPVDPTVQWELRQVPLN